MDLCDFLKVIREATKAGLINWKIEDVPPKMEPFVAGIGELPAFIARIEDYFVIVYAFWKGWTGDDSGRRLVICLELIGSDGESAVSSDPRDKCLYLEKTLELLETYLVVFWAGIEAMDPKLIEKMYILDRDGIPLDFMPRCWSAVEFVRHY